jgi:ADP-ribose pyrophosphatase YjhB (NUDIX family)
MIQFDKDGWRFNYRVAGILIRDGRVLLERDMVTGNCCLPGGRVEFGEPAGEAVVREMREEFGVEVKNERLIWAVDNFFMLDGLRYHELSFYFLMSLPEGAVLPEEESMPNRDNPQTVLEWHALLTLDDVNLCPTFLRAGLRALPDKAEYLVHIDTPLKGIVPGKQG